MKRLPLLGLALAALLAAGCSTTQQVAPPSQQPAPPADESAVETVSYDPADLTFPELPDVQLPAIETLTLDNGMRIFLIEDHELPMISATARIGTGSVYVPAEKIGLASITGTVMRTGGTETMTPEEINQTLEGLGATVESGIGETSGSAYMNTLAEHVDTVLPIFADVLMHPAFAEEKVELAKSQRKSSISRRNDNSQQIAFREFAQLLYGEDNPYARVAQYWTIDAIERADLVAFHEHYYHPNNVLLSVWGDFDAEAMKDRLREAFGGWQRPEGFEPPTPPAPDMQTGYSVHFIPKSDVTQSTILMGHPGQLTRDEADYVPVIVMNEVLSGGFSGRLFQNVRSDQGLAYSVFGQYGAGYRRPGQFFAGVFTKSGTTVEATESVLHEIERMRQAPPTEEELRLAKSSYLNSFVFNFDTEREILSRLMTYATYEYPRDFLNQVKNGVQEVTAQDVFRVSKEYLHPDEVAILIVGHGEEFGEPLSTLTMDGGEVQETDITIPTSPPGAGEETPASAEAQAGGQALLAQVKEALGGAAFDQITNFRATSRQTVQAPAGEQTLESTIAVKLPGQLHVEVTLPNGMAITIVDDGEQMTMQTPMGTQPAPAAMREQTMAQLWRSLSYLLARTNEVEAADAGTVDVEGETYTALEITPPQGSAFTLLLDPETMRPARMQFQGTNPQTGAPFEAASVFSDYREVGGITIPFETITFQDGQERSTSTTTSFEVNADLAEGLFAVEQGQD